MPKVKKQKTSNSGGSQGLEKASQICILHVNGIQHGEFIPLANIKCSHEKLAKLHSIREKRLIQPNDSATRMEVVCNNIPESLTGLDLDVTGYHRGCYQKFTKNLDRLKCGLPDDQLSTPRSPRKLPSIYRMAMHYFIP